MGFRIVLNGQAGNRVYETEAEAQAVVDNFVNELGNTSVDIAVVDAESARPGGYADEGMNPAPEIAEAVAEVEVAAAETAELLVSEGKEEEAKELVTETLETLSDVAEEVEEAAENVAEAAAEVAETTDDEVTEAIAEEAGALAVDAEVTAAAVEAEEDAKAKVVDEAPEVSHWFYRRIFARRG